MRIVIDARWIYREISGIGRYTQELLRHLPEVGPAHEFQVLFNDDAVRERTWFEAGLGRFANVRALSAGHGPFHPGSQVCLPSLLRHAKADLFFSPNYMIPFAAFPRGRTGRVRCAVTLHDLIPLLFPHYTPRAVKTRFFPVFRWVMRQAAARADLILTPSDSTARDVREHLLKRAAHPPRVVSTPEACGEQYRPDPAVPRVPGLILFVGRFDPYKNLPSLVKAFSTVRARVPAARLRIVGPPDPRYPEARDAARSLKLDDAIEWKGYATGDELLRSYREASVFALPSRYEGFGLPVLEAMACGTPVVCGNGSSLPEVAGDAAILVDPDNAAALAEGLIDVLTRPDRAAELARRGVERARLFSWRRTAERTLRAFEGLF